MLIVALGASNAFRQTRITSRRVLFDLQSTAISKSFEVTLIKYSLISTPNRARNLPPLLAKVTLQQMNRIAASNRRNSPQSVSVSLVVRGGGGVQHQRLRSRTTLLAYRAAFRQPRRSLGARETFKEGPPAAAATS